MIITSDILRNKLKSYSNKSNKISREVKSGKLIKIKKGLYETDPNIPGYFLAMASYLSFDFALYYYGLIPEKVVSYTSATFKKREKKHIRHHLVNFIIVMFLLMSIILELD